MPARHTEGWINRHKANATRYQTSETRDHYDCVTEVARYHPGTVDEWVTVYRHYDTPDTIRVTTQDISLPGGTMEPGFAVQFGKVTVFLTPEALDAMLAGVREAVIEQAKALLLDSIEAAVNGRGELG